MSSRTRIGSKPIMVFLIVEAAKTRTAGLVAWRLNDAPSLLRNPDGGRPIIKPSLEAFTSPRGVLFR